MRVRASHRPRTGTWTRLRWALLALVAFGLCQGLNGASRIRDVPEANADRHAGIKTVARGEVAEPAQGISRCYGEASAAADDSVPVKPALSESLTVRPQGHTKLNSRRTLSSQTQVLPATPGAGQQGAAMRDCPHAECPVCHPHREPYQGRDAALDRNRLDQPTRHGTPGRSSSAVASAGEAQEVVGAIPLETCFRCHFDPRLASTNGIGDASVHYGGRHDGTGRGLLCQDCHTAADMHAQEGAEIRCEDCHGTTERYPWELPLGRDGAADSSSTAARLPRGVALGLAAAGGKFDARDGYLLTSRGNPFGNVVRNGDRVWLQSVTGAVYEVTQLKRINEQRSWRSQLSQQVKSAPDLHKNMACLDCHADWLPPCLGCHEKSSPTVTDKTPRSTK